ncbi:hypothetical protein [Jeotgalicoccus sp. WY2]|uniref:hypothetical protein n=1 Tax=Jeotgalicoccus sp. WY2 TaxID=2708346 RepID=UPI001BD4EA0D|nr:hypothetical protein [Jeotgalicoccus sp. WY2]
MFRIVFLETFKKIYRNKKNRLIFLLAFLGIILYSFLYLPNVNNPLTIDMDELALETESAYGMKESRLDSGDIAVNSFTGIDTYSVAKYDYENNLMFYDALEKGDVSRLFEVKSTNYVPLFTVEALNDYLERKHDGQFLEMDFERAMINSNLFILSEIDNPTTHEFNGKTGIQQLYSFFLTYGPLIILFITIFVASEVLVDDRKHHTLKAGQPLGWRKYIFYQSLSMFIIIMTGIALLLTVFFLLISLLYGFGDLSLLNTNYAYNDGYRAAEENFFTAPVTDFILQSLILTALLLYLFIRLNAVLSLVFRHDVIVMIAGFAIIAFNRLYSGGGEDKFLGIGAHLFPQNYFEFGNILSGHQNFLTLSNNFTFDNGLIVLFTTIIIIEIILGILAGFITRQKFVRQVG